MQPDITGMVQDPAELAEERLEKIEPQTARQDQNDMLYVKNIDVDCDDMTYDTIRITEKWRDPDPEAQRRVITRFRDVTNRYNHNEGFTVKFSNHPFTIPPGAVMRMPRYIGEHYASKLADHMLDKKGGEKRMLRNDPIERPAIIALIIIREEPFAAMMPQTVGERAALEVEKLNETPIAPFSTDDGQVYDTKGQKMADLPETDATPTDQIATTVGNINKSQVEPTEQVIARLPDSEEDNFNLSEKWQKTTKGDIIQLIRDMVPDYKFGRDLTKSQLVAILEKL